MHEVTVRGTDHAGIHLPRDRVTEPSDLALLEHAQQRCLNGLRNVADLVQEQRSTVGRLEEALLIAHMLHTGPKTQVSTWVSIILGL